MLAAHQSFSVPAIHLHVQQQRSERERDVGEDERETVNEWMERRDGTESGDTNTFWIHPPGFTCTHIHTRTQRWSTHAAHAQPEISNLALPFYLSNTHIEPCRLSTVNSFIPPLCLQSAICIKQNYTGMQQQAVLILSLKGQFTPLQKIMSSYICHIISNMCDFLCFSEHKRRYFGDVGDRTDPRWLPMYE